MPNHDAFSAQLVDFVRKMSDDAILALVRAQIGGISGSLPQARAAVSDAFASVKAGRPLGRRPGRPPSKPVAAAPVAAAPAAPAAAPRAAKAAKASQAAKPAKAPKLAKAPKAAKAAKAPKAAKAGGAKRGRGSAAGRMELLSAVERIVKSSGGVSASEVAKSAGVPQSRASSALKELKLAKRVFQGGDRRFARYAGSASSALAASDGARKNASGPLTKGGKRK